MVRKTKDSQKHVISNHHQIIAVENYKGDIPPRGNIFIIYR